MRLVNDKQIENLLAGLGVSKGDRIFIHAFLPSLGVVKGGLCEITRVIIDYIGQEGTLIVPTFTSSYRRNEVYDVSNSRSINGALSEFVRKNPASSRSLDPLFSMSAIGRDSKTLMTRQSTACFGKGSIYEKLFRSKVKFLGIGVDWNQGYSFFMHLERLAKVPYRAEKKYFGKTRLANGRLINDEAIHYARIEDDSWSRDRTPVCEQLVAQNKIHQITLDGCAHRLFEASVIEEEVVNLLREDPWCMTRRALK